MYKIYLSPSVQEKNVGAGTYGTEERQMNIIGNFLENLLLKDGRFIIYRNNPLMSLKEVVADSNVKKVSLHIAIHSNAGNKKARGCEVWYNLFSGNGKKLAKCIYDEMEILTPTADRGIKGTFSLREVKVKAVSCLIETIFHDNIDDARWLISHRQAVAKAIYQGIVRYVKNSGGIRRVG